MCFWETLGPRIHVDTTLICQILWSFLRTGGNCHYFLYHQRVYTFYLSVVQILWLTDVQLFLMDL